MTQITEHVMIGAFDELPPEGAEIIDLRDIPDHCAIRYSVFEEMVSRIDRVVGEGRTAFVHCIGGISRSPTIVAAWMCKHNDMSATEAIAFIKARRPKIEPHPSQLRSLEEFLKQS